MKAIDDFFRSLSVLEKADFNEAENDEIYHMGVICQFRTTFERAWKALKFILEQDGVGGAETGSARDILKLSAKCGFLQDESTWLLMLKKRNQSTHIYNEEEADELLILIRDSFVRAFQNLEKFLLKKQREIEEDA
ncbi:MAG: HI0074 family nucleotidyltransferase substrate-binding subunit [Lachnospiraceae bacterium]|jgi:nucleotidyltransferase substrate binding protein (TIGR01987 family)|nr:HI0074 family nucleotidyltransferase substrate-binding subunit [Lachnospiraceae bacterium]MCH4030077.1 HI0074 family nucleotidyltransferase substrate-binding subunit [Lachnospiraceae bacterium]MCH4070269.1 HI0074 family nucleotidyltransferase substrate-binding subunit [Lachnospiraceae bacterium]MCH4107775.1 HI0074 family nucleotidyltransferase substrate-binding subunit [Lachnospiraceae bacterium]MCI1301374.1 HI0074 family nucleotidyltransferase substrate-binding subunit [Lachnospiraceae bact